MDGYSGSGCRQCRSNFSACSLIASIAVDKKTEKSQTFDGGLLHLNVKILLYNLDETKSQKHCHSDHYFEQALFCTLLPVSYIVGFSIFLILAFSILGTGMFGNKLFRCSIGAEFPAGKSECSGSEISLDNGILLPRSWQNPEYNFDSMYESGMSLFRMIAGNYVDVLNDCMDITDENISPLKGNSISNGLYVLVFLFFGYVVVMNIFIA